MGSRPKGACIMHGYPAKVGADFSEKNHCVMAPAATRHKSFPCMHPRQTTVSLPVSPKMEGWPTGRSEEPLRSAEFTPHWPTVYSWLISFDFNINVENWIFHWGDSPVYTWCPQKREFFLVVAYGAHVRFPTHALLRRPCAPLLSSGSAYVSELWLGLLVAIGVKLPVRWMAD